MVAENSHSQPGVLLDCSPVFSGHPEVDAAQQSPGGSALMSAVGTTNSSQLHPATQKGPHGA